MPCGVHVRWVCVSSAAAVVEVVSRALLSLGSNQNAGHYFEAALQALQSRFGAVTVSAAYVFPAVGFDGPDFLNAGVALDTDMDVYSLNDWLHALEDAHQRDRSGPRFGNRTLDIDIVYFGEAVVSGPGHLQIPRPDIKHAFVLKPLAEIAPDFIDPVRELPLAEMWRAHPDYTRTFETRAVPGFL